MYRLYCDSCGYNRFTDGSDIQDLVPYKRSSIMSSTPVYDPKQKKIITKKNINLPKQFKCPQCGRLVTARKMNSWPEPPKENNENLDTRS